MTWPLSAWRRRDIPSPTILTVIVTIKPIGVPDHHAADGSGASDVVGQLATEHRKQTVGISDCAADRRRVGAVGDVELGGDQLIGQD